MRVRPRPNGAPPKEVLRSKQIRSGRRGLHIPPSTTVLLPALLGLASYILYNNKHVSDRIRSVIQVIIILRETSVSVYENNVIKDFRELCTRIPVSSVFHNSSRTYCIAALNQIF